MVTCVLVFDCVHELDPQVVRYFPVVPNRIIYLPLIGIPRQEVVR